MAEMHRCAHPRCPGYAFKASELAHPAVTCGANAPGADGEAAQQTPAGAPPVATREVVIDDAHAVAERRADDTGGPASLDQEPAASTAAADAQPVLPGFSWKGSHYEHPTGTWAVRDMVTERWAYFRSGARSCDPALHRDSALQAGAAALGYTLEQFPEQWRWVLDHDGLRSLAGGFATADAAALSALQDAERRAQQTPGADGPLREWLDRLVELRDNPPDVGSAELDREIGVAQSGLDDVIANLHEALALLTDDDDQSGAPAPIFAATLASAQDALSKMQDGELRRADCTCPAFKCPVHTFAGSGAPVKQTPAPTADTRAADLAPRHPSAPNGGDSGTSITDDQSGAPAPARKRVPLPGSVPRTPGCKCHQEEGDSPCPVHGDESESGAPAPAQQTPAPTAALTADHARSSRVAPSGGESEPRKGNQSSAPEPVCRHCGRDRSAHDAWELHNEYMGAPPSRAAEPPSDLIEPGAPAPATLRCDCCKVLRSRVQHMRPDALGDIFAICDLCMRSVHDAHAAAKHEEPVR